MDPELSDLASTDSKVLRDKMHELRRTRTDSWGMYSPPGERQMNYELCKLSTYHVDIVEAQSTRVPSTNDKWTEWVREIEICSISLYKLYKISKNLHTAPYKPFLKFARKATINTIDLSDIHASLSVIPKSGVPPAYVLQKLVPGEPLAALEEWTPQQYGALKAELQNLSDWRAWNLDGTNCAKYPSHTCVNGAFQRRKREDAAAAEQGRYSMHLDIRTLCCS